MEFRQVVIDNGTRNMRAGFRGDDVPNFIFPTVVGRLTKEEHRLMQCGYIRQTQPRHPLSDDLLSLIDKFLPQRHYVAEEAMKMHDRYQYHPIQQGLINNWDDMEAIWNYTFYNQLNISPEEHPIFMTDRTLNPKEAREKSVEIMFERFNVSQLYIANKTDLICYASGRNGGVAVDCGYDTCVIGPRCEGYLLPHAVGITNYGGKNITESLYKLLNENADSVPIPLHIVRDIKEKTSFIKHEGDSMDKKDEIKYELPDGNVIELDRNKLSECCEVLFGINDKDKGLADMIYESILKMDISYRKEIFSNIVLSGGTAMINGLKERLQSDIKKLIGNTVDSAINYKVEVIVPVDAIHASFVGGSIMASLSTFQEMWITRDEYDENGASIVHRKCY